MQKTISFLNCDTGLLTIALLAMLIYLLHPKICTHKVSKTRSTPAVWLSPWTYQSAVRPCRCRVVSALSKSRGEGGPSIGKVNMLCSDNIKERGLRGAMRELGFQNVVLLVIEIGLPPLHTVPHTTPRIFHNDCSGL